MPRRICYLEPTIQIQHVEQKIVVFLEHVFLGFVWLVSYHKKHIQTEIVLKQIPVFSKYEEY